MQKKLLRSRWLTVIAWGLAAMVAIGRPCPAEQVFNDRVRIAPLGMFDTPTLYFGADDDPSEWALQAAGNDLNFTNYAAGNTPFIIHNSAPSYSLYLSPVAGNIGLKTFNPLRSLHIAGDDSLGLPIIRFEDGSTLPNTWDLEGTGIGFNIKDITAATTPFSILPGAPTNSMFVSSDGRFGLGTSLPQKSIHVSEDDNVPTIRLEVTTGVQQLVPYIWDIEASDQGFFVFDKTVGSEPFHIRKGAPTSSLYVDTNGSIGMGDNNPSSIIGFGSPPDVGRHLKLLASTGTARSIVSGATAAESYLVQHAGGNNKKIVRTMIKDGKYVISTLTDNLANIEHPFVVNLATTHVGIKTPNPTKPLQVGDPGSNDGNGAHVTPGGVWTNASSRSVKQDIHPITSEQARETVRALQPVGYRYKNELEEQYVGFIAEDVPELVATGDRKSLASMDITAVLTRVVQDQDRQLEEQRRLNEEQKKANDEQKQLIARQHELLMSLSSRLADLEKKSCSTAP